MFNWFKEQRERRAWVKKQQRMKEAIDAQVARDLEGIDDFVAGAIAGAILASDREWDHKTESQDSNARE